MLYNFDPILPFEYVDKLENRVLSDEEADYQGDIESDAGSNFSGMTTDPVFSKIEKLENQHKEIFNKANKSIKKLKSIRPNVSMIGKLRGNHLRLAVKFLSAM